METPMKTLPNLLLTRLHSEHSEQSQGPATPYTEDVPEIINVEEDTGSEEEDEPETSNVFTRSQVFVVAAVSKGVQLGHSTPAPLPDLMTRVSLVASRDWLQLLQGSQFLYSMRGLPTVMRCQRNARALEWGPAHVSERANGRRNAVSDEYKKIHLNLRS
eukprot:XP_001691524.1 predicted protein [Chlamydomonas reinhardtii]